MRSYVAFCLAMVLLAGANAQAGILYVTDGDSSRLARVDTVAGGAATVTTTHSGGYPIVVDTTVHIGVYYGPNAVEYQLNGTPTGSSVATADINAVDAGFDPDNGVAYHLGNAFNTVATVYRSDESMTAGSFQALFGVSGSDLVGITYDTALDALWISDEFNIYRYSVAGVLLQTFAHSGGRGSLAYEQATDSLWYTRNGSNSVFQYSKAGALLQTKSFSGLAANNWGSEFAMFPTSASTVPEPASMALLAMGGGLLAFGRKKLNRRPQTADLAA